MENSICLNGPIYSVNRLHDNWSMYQYCPNIVILWLGSILDDFFCRYL